MTKALASVIISSIFLASCTTTTATNGTKGKSQQALVKYRGPVTIDLTRKWTQRTIEQRPFLGGFDNPYILCRIDVNERSRNKRDKRPEYADSGYRLIQVSNGSVQWQVWVTPSGQAFGGRRWVLADFSASWIRDDATLEEKKANRCLARLPVTMPPFPIPDDSDRTSQPDYKYRVLRRLVCTNGKNEFLGDDIEQTSNKSCADAAQTLDATLRSKDYCEWRDNNRWPGYSMVRTINIPTSECA